MEGGRRGSVLYYTVGQANARLALVLTPQKAASHELTREVLGGHLASSVRERQALLSEVRARLLYDWQGEEEDAFSALLEELVAVVSGLKRREARLEERRIREVQFAWNSTRGREQGVDQVPL